MLHDQAYMQNNKIIKLTHNWHLHDLNTNPLLIAKCSQPLELVLYSLSSLSTLINLGIPTLTFIK